MAVNGRKTVLLHFDSSESEKRNQLALIESQLFFNTVQNEETGEVTVPTNKLPNEVRFYCNCFDGEFPIETPPRRTDPSTKDT